MDSSPTQDVALVSKKIFVMDDRSRVVSGTVIIRDGRITEVVEGRTPPPNHVQVVDVGDRPVLPGFVDSHVHLEMGATALWHAVDCHTPPCDSIDDVLDQLVAHTDIRHERGGWLVGQGGLFADRRFSDGRLPHRADLDRVSTDFPIAVKFGGHVTVLNSKAMELGFDAGLEQVGAGMIDRDATGTPDGVIHDLYHLLPIPELTDDQRERGITGLARKLVTNQGVTTIGEITDTPDGIRYIASIAGTDALPLRVRGFAWVPATWPLDVLLTEPDDVFPEPTTTFRMQGIKLFIDGGISAAGAAMLRPYVQRRDGKEHYGRLAYDLDHLVDIIHRADAHSLQVAAHAVGDRAQRLLCEAAIRARTHGEQGATPVRVEHGGNIVGDLETIEHWRRASAVPVAQGVMLWSLGSVVADYAGDYIKPGLFPFRTLLDQGWDLAMSSDGSGSEPLNFNPLFGVQCAVDRTTCMGESLNPEQRTTVMEALRMNTAAAAAAMGMADEIGTIQPGKVADIAVLGADPREVRPHEISTITVDRVLLGGRLVGGTEFDAAESDTVYGSR